MPEGNAPAPAPRVLMPTRSKLAEALACVLGVPAVDNWRGAGDYAPALEWLGKDRVPASSGPITDPAEAWEALATRGVIPMEWVGDARRGFEAVCPRCRGRGRVLEYDEAARAYVARGGRVGKEPCPVCPRRPHPHKAGTGVGVAPNPPTVAAVVALACDVPNVMAAEALAWEIAALSLPGSSRTRQARRVVWRFTPTREMDRTPWLQLDECQRRAEEILALGYAFDGVDDDALVLVCPEVSDGR